MRTSLQILKDMESQLKRDYEITVKQQEIASAKWQVIRDAIMDVEIEASKAAQDTANTKP